MLTQQHFDQWGVTDWREAERVTVDQIEALGPQFHHITTKMRRYGPEGRKVCKACEESMRINGHVCGYHYHDYTPLCDYDGCRKCWLVHQFLRLHPEQEGDFYDTAGC